MKAKLHQLYNFFMEQSDVLLIEEQLFKDIRISFAGKAVCQPGHSYGPAVRPVYLIHVVTKGRGVFKSQEGEYHLKAGQGFLIEPDIITHYAADLLDPWEYLWVGISGERAGFYLSTMGLSKKNPILKCSDLEKIQQVVDGILRFSTPNLTQQLQRQSLLFEFLSLIAADLSLQDYLDPSYGNEYLTTGILYIQNHYMEPLQIQDLAEQIGIDRTYLYHLFQKHTHMSPKDYLSLFRLTRAKELLAVTDLQIGEIARRCGYPDSLVFSKAFKRQFELTPTQWRCFNSSGDTENRKKRIKQQKSEHDGKSGPNHTGHDNT